jgi:hypothetical protein
MRKYERGSFIHESKIKGKGKNIQSEREMRGENLHIAGREKYIFFWGGGGHA